MKITFEERDRKQYADLMADWVAKLPNPDEPVIGFAADESYSPRQMVEEMRAGTEIGNQYLEALAENVIDDAIRRQYEKTG